MYLCSTPAIMYTLLLAAAFWCKVTPLMPHRSLVIRAPTLSAVVRHGLRRRYASSVIQASVIRAVCARVVSLPLLPEALNAAVPARHDACCTEGLAVNLRRTRRCFASIVIIFLFVWPTSLADCGRGRLFFGAQSHSGIAVSPLRAPHCFGEDICALWEVNGLPA